MLSLLLLASSLRPALPAWHWLNTCSRLRHHPNPLTPLHPPPGLYEYQLEAAFVGEAMRGGLRDLGYPAIVCAGRNAAILHYERNSSLVGPQDLVLVDAGAEFRWGSRTGCMLAGWVCWWS